MAQSVLQDTLQQEADMIRSRGQIRRVLCVAEKNDAAKGISEIMSSGRARRVSHIPSHTLTSDRQICQANVSTLYQFQNV